MNLTFDHVHKQFGDLPVVEGFSSEFKTGELVALVGPSGCGKSTLLHLAAGLEAPTQGQVLADGKPVAGPHPSRTLVFQEHALYPWLTLQDNVALALEFQNIPKARARTARATGWPASVWAASRSTTRIRCPAACVSAPRWRAPSSPSRRPC